MIDKALRQQEDTAYYWPLVAPIFLQTLPKQKYINKKQSTYLLGDLEHSMMKIYNLPEIHDDPAIWKPPFVMPPGRPITSDCGSDMDRIATTSNTF